MPLVRISVPDSLAREKVRALADAVHAALVTTCNVPLADRFQVIQRFPVDAMILDPTFGNVSRGPEASIVEITFLSGRSDNTKRALYADIAHRAKAAGFRGDDVMVALTENHAIDWSLGFGLSYAQASAHPAPAA